MTQRLCRPLPIDIVRAGRRVQERSPLPLGAVLYGEARNGDVVAAPDRAGNPIGDSGQRRLSSANPPRLSSPAATRYAPTSPSPPRPANACAAIGASAPPMIPPRLNAIDTPV